MKRFLALSIAIVLFQISIAQASIRLTEIAWMGTSESSFCEWFEFYNDGADLVDLAGWRLYEDEGNQVVFTMTKTVPSQGHLLVERTTPSCPDPVSNISDELGSFGGSGFSNTGENLVLKDSQGTTIQTLNFSSGWPAGDATTKETMQWDGSKWVTATATPKASLQGGGSIQTPEEVSSGIAWSSPKIVPHIDLFVPKYIFATVVNEYSQKTFLEYGQVYNGVFLWNMGDGSVYRSNTPNEVKHAYKYPGTYTIAYAYYKTPYDTKPLLMETREQLVISPTISLRTLPQKGFEFSNSGDTSVDISSWVVVLSDTFVELPPLTIIPAKTTVLMPFSSFGLGQDYTNGILQTPQRTSINKESVPEKIIAHSLELPMTSTFIKSVDNPDYEASAIGVLPEAQKNVTAKPKTKLIVFALVLVVVIGLFVILERFIGSQSAQE